MCELKLPEFSNANDAALWVRENSRTLLTNEIFKGILTDIMKRPIRDEEFMRAKVLSCPPAYHPEGYLTVEEKEELDITCSGNESLMKMVSYTISEQGILVRFERPTGIWEILSGLF